MFEIKFTPKLPYCSNIAFYLCCCTCLLVLEEILLRLNSYLFFKCRFVKYKGSKTIHFQNVYQQNKMIFQSNDFLLYPNRIPSFEIQLWRVTQAYRSQNLEMIKHVVNLVISHKRKNRATWRSCVLSGWPSSFLPLEVTVDSILVSLAQWLCSPIQQTWIDWKSSGNLLGLQARRLQLQQSVILRKTETKYMYFDSRIHHCVFFRSQ